jgi:hypothetical protein
MASGVFRGSTGRTLEARSWLVAISLTATIAGCGAGLDNGFAGDRARRPTRSKSDICTSLRRNCVPPGERAGAERRNGCSATKASGAQSFVVRVEREEGDSGRGAGDDLRDQIHPQRRPGEHAHHGRADSD